MATETAGKDPLKFLKQKAGPLPVGVWAGAAVVIWWYLQRKQAKPAAGAGQQTDPAGNTGTIDPLTGYVTGSPQDTAQLATDNSSGGGGSAGQNATTGGQKYADNNSWGIAAVNYLVGTGINGTVASDAIQAYLNSQVLTSTQQGLVNLAIQWLGAPPSLPAPATAGSGGGSTGGGSTGGGDSGGGSSGGSGGGSSSGGGSGGSGGGGSAAGQSTISGGREISVGTTTATIGWTPHGRANGWDLVIVGPGPINGHRGTTRVPEGVYSGLQSGHNYRVTITPMYNGVADGPAGYVDIKTR